MFEQLWLLVSATRGQCYSIEISIVRFYLGSWLTKSSLKKKMVENLGADVMSTSLEGTESFKMNISYITLLKSPWLRALPLCCFSTLCGEVNTQMKTNTNHKHPVRKTKLPLLSVLREHSTYWDSLLYPWVSMEQLNRSVSSRPFCSLRGKLDSSCR